MKEKIVIHGPGYYLLTLSGTRKHAIFNSVFDYQYGEDALARLQRAKVVGFCMAPEQLMLLVYCEQDWPDIVDQLQAMFRQHNEQCWRHSRPVISDTCHSVHIDTMQYLSKALLQIHQYPVHQRWVIDAALYPWSSDRFYRTDDNAPSWLNPSAVLNQLCKTHHHQALRYEAAMASPLTVVFDLKYGNHSDLVALSQRSLSDYHQRGYQLAKPAETIAKNTPSKHDDIDSHGLQILEYSDQDSIASPLNSANTSAITLEQLSDLLDDALNLVAHQFETPIEQWKTNQHRRQYNRLMPIVVWLLHKIDIPTAILASSIDESDDRIKFWLRSIEQQHPQKLLLKILGQWQSQYQEKSKPELTTDLPTDVSSITPKTSLRRSKRKKSTKAPSSPTPLEPAASSDATTAITQTSSQSSS